MGPNDRIIGEREPPGVHLEGAGIASPARISPISPPSMVSSGVSMVIWPPAPSPEVPLASPLPPTDGDRLGGRDAQRPCSPTALGVAAELGPR